jgi:phosphatidate phosphatase APP1
MKTTKDVYIPTISNTISQLASEATSRAMSDNGGQSANAGSDLTGAEIVVYPHFTRPTKEVNEDGVEALTFYTQVHGWVFSTHGSSRKKRLVLTLARQLAKSKNNAVSEMTANEIDEQINTINSDQDSIASAQSEHDSRPSSSYSDSISSLKRRGTGSSDASSIASSTLSRSDMDDTLRERIANFVNRSLGNLELTICIGGASRDDITIKKVVSDENGNFNIDIPTSFSPTYIQVAITADEKIFQFRNSIFPGKSKYAIISDIDDTIKKTGVCGDRRQLFRNTFSEHISTWQIPGASDCYRYFNQQYDMPIFYVSNSPYQLYANLVKFFDMFEFPQGSMYLKKYTGNLLNSIMEPSHVRKKAPLERILNHFGDKKFFLIGDTGEQDLEAYVDTARLFPGKVQGIFLRVAEGSMNKETLKSLKDILAKKNVDIQGYEGSRPQDEADLIDLENDVSDQLLAEKESELKATQVLDNTIDLEQGSNTDFFTANQAEPSPSKGPPPIVPKKPEFLKSQKVASRLTSAAASPDSQSKLSSSGSETSRDSEDSVAPSLPKRSIPTPPALPKRRAPVRTESPPNEGVPYNDQKHDEWLSRLLTSLIVLRKVDPKIKLRFFVDFAEVQEDIHNIVKSEGRQ